MQFVNNRETGSRTDGNPLYYLSFSINLELF